MVALGRGGVSYERGTHVWFMQMVLGFGRTCEALEAFFEALGITGVPRS